MAEINEAEVQRVQNMISGFAPESETEETEETTETAETKKTKKTKSVKQQESKISNALSILSEAVEIEPIEIYLPGFKKKAEIKPLTSGDELFLNTARLSFDSFMTKVNSLIFKKITIDGKPATEYFSNLDTFLQYLLPIDRSLIIFGIIKVSFDSLSSNEFICEKCGKSFIEELEVINLEMKFDDEVLKIIEETDLYNLNKEVNVIKDALRITLGFNSEDIRLKIMALEDDNTLKRNVMDNTILSNINNFLYFLKKIEVIKNNKVVEKFEIPDFLVDDDEETTERKNKEFYELVDFSYNLPLKIQDVLMTKITDNINEFENYIPKFLFNLVCPYCGEINTQIISPEIEFFRKTLSYSG